ncbi:MAG: adenylosuccinate synthetase [Bacteroidetes bacterium]|nr:adenylosuccinate synthetase [Bacteroidota bacterium]
MRKASIVVGLGFGDEGKGLATDFLVRQARKPLVVRYNGGQQAGHTVSDGQGKRHVFSNFGAGSLAGAPTYWSQFCTFAPANLLKEFAALEQLGVRPRLLVDALCPVTTHYDVLYNQLLEQGRGAQRHGSCGMGFGATVERHESSPARLYAQDLLFPEICALKLPAIRQYYRQKLENRPDLEFDAYDHDAADAHWLELVSQLLPLKNRGILEIVTEQAVFAQNSAWQHFIFEGAQGILLDMDFGFFPHVTRSNTSSKNAFDLLRRNHFFPETEVVYISRCYQTRHGAGPFAWETDQLHLQNNALETNVFNDYQGHFRYGFLSLDQLQYALQCDRNFSGNTPKKLLLTCADQMPEGRVTCYLGGEATTVNVDELPGLVGNFEGVWVSWGDWAGKVR